jgi:Flp pilus assembly pilin Flp
MVAPFTFHAARCKTLATLRELFQNETGSSVVEYLLMLSLVSIGAKTILGNYASVSNTLVQNLIDGLRTVFPS